MNNKTTKAQKSGRNKTLKIPECKHFNGYKPCFPGTNCIEDGCIDPKPYGKKILIVNLEAMGNVLVTTTLLPAIKRKYPGCSISWITLNNAIRLLDHNPYLDRIYLWEPENWMKLQSMQFDIVMNIDKAVHACAFTMLLSTKHKLGYGLNAHGAIVPLNPEAEYNYMLGLDDHLKFRVNQKPNTQLLTEAMGLHYQRDEYTLTLTHDELRFCESFRREMEITAPLVIGFNTGCSLLYPNKKMTIDQHVVLINALSTMNGVQLLLLGGPEDTERNAEIVRQVGNKVISTPTTEGLRKGMCYENLCDVVVSGDSFGMHVAIALKKYVIVWFGVSCPQEIDLFDRGVKLVPEGLECSPCWKKTCPFNLECIQLVDLHRIVQEITQYKAILGKPIKQRVIS